MKPLVPKVGLVTSDLERLPSKLARIRLVRGGLELDGIFLDSLRSINQAVRVS